MGPGHGPGWPLAWPWLTLGLALAGLGTSQGPSVDHAFCGCKEFTKRLTSALRADAFGILDESAKFNPMPFLDASSRALLTDPAKLFAKAPPSLERFSGMRADHKRENARLICR